LTGLLFCRLLVEISVIRRAAAFEPAKTSARRPKRFLRRRNKTLVTNSSPKIGCFLGALRYGLRKTKTNKGFWVVDLKIDTVGV